MTELMDRAVRAVTALPPEAQDGLALMMLAASGQEGGVYRLTPDDVAAVGRSREAAARGAFATDEQLEAHRAKYRE